MATCQGNNPCNRYPDHRKQIRVAAKVKNNGNERIIPLYKKRGNICHEIRVVGVLVLGKASIQAPTEPKH